MDWPESTEPVLTAFPRGMQRDGRETQQEVTNPYRWTSRFGSIVTTMYGELHRGDSAIEHIDGKRVVPHGRELHDHDE